MDDLVTAKLQEALGVEQPDPGMRARVLSALPVDEAPGRRFGAPSFEWAGGVLAVILGVAVVAGMLYLRGGLAPSHPATTGPIGHVDMAVQVDFRCSLPVLAYNSTYAVVALPDGSVLNRSTAPASGQGKGVFGPSGYDVQAGKWLPVSQNWISPDGKRYAYSTQTTGVPGQGPTGTIHVVDVASGGDRQLWAGDGAAQVLAFLAGGIYFMKQGMASPAQDLWVVDPNRAGAARRVGPNPAPPPPDPTKPGSFGPTTFFYLIGPLGAFGMGYSTPADTSKPMAGAIFPNRVVRMDLATGNTTTWYANPSGMVSLIGLDPQGHPIIGEGQAPAPTEGKPYLSRPSHVMLLTGENQTVDIALSTDTSFLPVSARGDAHGIWISSPGSVWLWDRSSGLRKVFTVPDSLFPLPGMGGPQPQPQASTGPPPGIPTGAYLQLIGPCA